MKLIDADLLKKNIRVKSEYFKDKTLYVATKDVISCIENAPAIHEIPFVNCKECIFYNTKECYMDNAVLFVLNDNDFCSFGRRKKDVSN